MWLKTDVAGQQYFVTIDLVNCGASAGPDVEPRNFDKRIPDESGDEATKPANFATSFQLVRHVVSGENTA